jgi:hypothetical protein
VHLLLAPPPLLLLPPRPLLLFLLLLLPPLLLLLLGRLPKPQPWLPLQLLVRQQLPARNDKVQPQRPQVHRRQRLCLLLLVIISSAGCRRCCCCFGRCLWAGPERQLPVELLHLQQQVLCHALESWPRLSHAHIQIAHTHSQAVRLEQVRPCHVSILQQQRRCARLNELQRDGALADAVQRLGADRSAAAGGVAAACRSVRRWCRTRAAAKLAVVCRAAVVAAAAAG